MLRPAQVVGEMIHSATYMLFTFYHLVSLQKDKRQRWEKLVENKQALSDKPFVLLNADAMINNGRNTILKRSRLWERGRIET